MTTREYFLPVSESGKVHHFGGKGKGLHVLWRNGFNIPATYCLTTKAYENFVESNSVRGAIFKTLEHSDMAVAERSREITGLIMRAEVPADISRELMEEGMFRDERAGWAVRSSSNMEDLLGESFAGLYDSYLNVKGLRNVVEAVKGCWASLWSERAIAYRERKRFPHEQASMAVIIQRMIEPEYAGVVFTRDPNGPNKAEMLLEYCEGIGEGLVSGRINPHSYRVDAKAGSVWCLNNEDQGRLGADRMRVLSKVASDIETCFGTAQDIEWAYDGDTFWILQSRPVTYGIAPQQISPDRLWTRANIGEVLPDVVTPLTWAVFKAILLGNPLESASSMGSAHTADELIRLVKGRVYIRLDGFLNSFCYLPFVTSGILERVLGLRSLGNPSAYTRPTGVRVRLAQAVFLLSAAGAFPWLSFMTKRLAPLAVVKQRGVEALMGWTVSSFRLHVKCTAYAIGAFAALYHCLKSWLPSEVDSLLPLLLVGSGDYQTARQGISLLELAHEARTNPVLTATLQRGNRDWDDIARSLFAVDGGPEFVAMFKSFLDANGARTAGEFELAVPRWREDSSFVLEMIQRLLGAASLDFCFESPELRRKRQQEFAGSIEARLPILKRRLFVRLLASYGIFSTMRENMKYRLMEGYAELRQAFLVIGEELKDRGMLAVKEDIFFMTPLEIDSSISGENNASVVNDLIRNRKEDHDHMKKERVCDLVAGDVDTMQVVAGERHGDNGLTGIGCSPGVAEGSARVLHDISETDSLKPGEILVAPHIDPGWTPLFLTCRAVVTEIGGFLSHGATVAREYAIPAVVNVTGAREQIKSGDLIRVDGEKGRVTVLKRHNIARQDDTQ
jgi:rifampicin phosphotransferase